MCHLKQEVEHAVKEIPRIPQESKEYLVSFFSAFFFVRAIPADMATHIRLSSPDLYSPEKVLSAAIKFSMNEREQKMYHGGRATAGAVGYGQEEKQPPSHQGPGPSHGNPPPERRNPPQESRKLTQSQLDGWTSRPGSAASAKRTPSAPSRCPAAPTASGAEAATTESPSARICPLLRETAEEARGRRRPEVVVRLSVRHLKAPSLTPPHRLTVLLFQVVPKSTTAAKAVTLL